MNFAIMWMPNARALPRTVNTRCSTTMYMLARWTHGYSFLRACTIQCGPFAGQKGPQALNLW